MAEAGSKVLANGAKARQREDVPDRDMAFSKVLSASRIPATDVDFVITNGGNVLRCVLEVTRPNDDQVVYSPVAYLAKIDQRRREQHNDNIILLIANTLHVPAFLVVYEPHIGQGTTSVWMRGIGTNETWERYEESDFLQRLQKFSTDGLSFLGNGQSVVKKKKLVRTEKGVVVVAA